MGGRATAVLVAIAGLAVGTAARADTVLSPAQQAQVTKATAGLGTAELKAIARWSDTRRIAEFLCRPAALPELKKRLPAADRVALGPEPWGAQLLRLEGNVKLTGRGTVRAGGGWRNFDFACELDPVRGTVTAFTFDLL